MSLAPLLEAGPVIQGHVASARLALTLGPVAIYRKSRDVRHRAAGVLWVLAMLSTALSSFFIHDARVWGPCSPIHLLSVLTLIGLVQGLRHLRAGRIQAHGRAMKGLYIQALILAGAFTFLPGRRMSAAVFPGAPQAGFGAVLILGLILGLVMAGLLWRDPSSVPPSVPRRKTRDRTD
jgi:uncharacterized membrane protein